MTKKDYELIAVEFKNKLSMIADDGNYGKTPVVELARGLATRLNEQNSRFDRERFLTACGITE